jgi:hypothetical protein
MKTALIPLLLGLSLAASGTFAQAGAARVDDRAASIVDSFHDALTASTAAAIEQRLRREL